MFLQMLAIADDVVGNSLYFGSSWTLAVTLLRSHFCGSLIHRKILDMSSKITSSFLNCKQEDAGDCFELSCCFKYSFKISCITVKVSLVYLSYNSLKCLRFFMVHTASTGDVTCMLTRTPVV